MGMAVDQTGQHRHFREIDHARIWRNREARPNRFNLVRPDDDDLIREDRTLVRIDEPPGLDHCYLRFDGCTCQQKNENQPEGSFQVQSPLCEMTAAHSTTARLRVRVDAVLDPIQSESHMLPSILKIKRSNAWHRT